jgi:hypothetical protein
MGLKVSFSPERELYIFRDWLLYNGIFIFFGAISCCTLYPRKKAWDAASIRARV